MQIIFCYLKKTKKQIFHNKTTQFNNNNNRINNSHKLYIILNKEQRNLNKIYQK